MKALEDRKFVILAIFFLIGLVYVARLFYIQVIDDTYISSAENQALRYVTQYPARGIIYDRNKELLVYNEAAYDLMVIPKQVTAIDTISFCELLGITHEEFLEKFKKAKNYSRYKASIFEKQITASAYAEISERLFKYPGFFGQKRTLRKYPFQSAAHTLGYVSEVNQEIINKDPYYKSGDYIGASGLERQYEDYLRGERGHKIFMVDVHNVVQGGYRNGESDQPATAGMNLVSTIDGKLQSYGELLMGNKRGSIVAIEPSTGEILSLVSTPAYDPNLLVGRDRSRNYQLLAKNDSLDPLFNRALMATYPPGSIFKMVQALVGLQEGVITDNTGFACNKSLVGCHNHPAASNLHRAIQFSCNPYFYNTFRKIINQGKSSSTFKDSEIGLDIWREHMLSFGLGQRLQLDASNLKSGSIPGSALYDRMYGSGRWAFSTIYSVSIGQGEVAVVPLQMANLAAIIANRGYYYEPHLIKSIEGIPLPSIYTEKHITSVESHYYETVVKAMQSVVDEAGGTARRARIDSIDVCGKTGTAENPHGEDHSVFIAFAPRDNPKIAIAVYVENAGFGGTWAAPIASLMIEKYINGMIRDKEKEKRILETEILTKS